MKLDPTVMRTMSGSDFRMLQAVEKGMAKGHEWVPVPLIASLAALRHGGTSKILSSLLRDKLLSHDKKQGYDGYRITNAGYDILALHHLKTISKVIVALGDKIGTGKESDIYLAMTPKGHQVVLKFHRLGRTSFRNVKNTRDYHVYDSNNHRRGNASSGSAGATNSWLFLSRKSALKEYAFMKALYEVQYPTPQPLGHNRHVVCMGLVRGVPLFQISRGHLTAEQSASIFHQASALALRLARHGLVHCDLNEFNLLVDLSGVQAKSLTLDEDPYVRHSGLSVAAESTPGMLNARGPWERDEELQFSPNHQAQQAVIDDGSVQNDTPIVPVSLLDNGQPTPLVTLIDFPQMVSTQHPNAEELYNRDMACLYKFFTHKLSCHIPAEEQLALCLKWEQVVPLLQTTTTSTTTTTAATTTEANDDDDDNDAQTTTGESVCLANKAQLRLDQELKASGYSIANSNRELELYYYNNYSTSEPQEKVETNTTDAVLEEEEEEDENQVEDNDGSDDEVEAPADDDNDDDDANKGLGNEPDDDDDDDDAATRNSQRTNPILLPPGQLANLSREQLQEQARLRVRQQLETEKKKGRQRGAFRKHNSNKSYVKGKRVFAEYGI
jgi:RIO kinase 2